MATTYIYQWLKHKFKLGNKEAKMLQSFTVEYAYSLGDGESGNKNSEEPATFSFSITLVRAMLRTSIEKEIESWEKDLGKSGSFYLGGKKVTGKKARLIKVGESGASFKKDGTKLVSTITLDFQEYYKKPRSSSGSKTYTSDSVSVAGKTKVEKVINYGKQFIGKVHYKFSATGPLRAGGLSDCSNFTQQCFLKAAGIDIKRTTDQQVKKGKAVSRSNLVRGDLVFYSGSWRRGVSHVAIYVGNGNVMHCGTSRGVCIVKLGVAGKYYTSRRIF